MIHSIGGNQDIRFIGGLSKILPLNIMFLLVAIYSLCGFPFLAGFYSRDLALEALINFNLNLLIIGLMYISTGITCAYSFRMGAILVNPLFKGEPNIMIDDMELGFTYRIKYLFFGALIRGAIMGWAVFDFRYILVLPTEVRILPIVLLLLGAVVSYGSLFINYRGTLLKYLFISKMWFLPDLSTQWVINYPLVCGGHFDNLGDRG